MLTPGRLASLLLALAFAIAFAPPLRAQQAAVPPPSAPQGNCTHRDLATRPDCPAAIAFLAKLQDAFKKNDRDAVASLVNYPLLVTAGGKRQIRSQAQLLAGFDHVFNASVRAVILNATADDVWGNSHGFMIGRGAIWFDAILPRNAAPGSTAHAPMKLITVNAVYP